VQTSDSAAPGSRVSARFFRPPPLLSRYFTSFYLAEVSVAGDGRLVDYLHPEWANLRFAAGAPLCASRHTGEGFAAAHFAVTGPSSKALRFDVGACRIWGVGLLPLGWAKFVGLPAGDFADAVFDGAAHADFAAFAPLAQTLFGPRPDCEAELARITAFFMARLPQRAVDEARIVALHAALVDAEVAQVAELAARTGLSARTVERLCHSAFGFSPKLLLRRQRFVRSLAQYMLDPSLKWIGVLDGHYHDQAQFVREFGEFMGLGPRRYRQMPHPVLDAFVAERARLHGSPMQALDRPQSA
jgi:AraC-like DNA-binding protein